MNRYLKGGVFVPLVLLVNEALPQPFLPPPPAAPGNRQKVLTESAQIASFIRRASSSVERRRLRRPVKMLARHMASDASIRLGTLGMPHVALSPVWNAKLDQLKHLPRRYLDTRYPLEMVKALEMERELCRSYIQRGQDRSTRFVATRWLGEINRDLPKFRKQTEAG